jgi:hypothetical protein
MSAELKGSAAYHKLQRRRLLAAINITWKEIRPDLGSADELREARLDFAATELRIPPIGSYSELSNSQLSKVLSAMQRERAQPSLAGCNVRRIQPAQEVADQVSRGTPAEVVHLASLEQTWAINRVFKYLAWTETGCEAFLRRNFQRNNVRTLTPKQARSALTILLHIAASRDIKARAAKERRSITVTKPMKLAEIPAIKRKLGIDLK